MSFEECVDRKNLLDVSNVTPRSFSKRVSGPLYKKTTSSRGRRGGRPKSSGGGGKENASPSSAISEDTVKQMASVIRTGAWDHVLMASDMSSGSPGSSFLSVAREMGIEMSYLTLKGKASPAGREDSDDNPVDLERYKRMQCEKIIGDLQGQLLGTQQDLAVAMAQGHKKDQQLHELNQLLEKAGNSWKTLDHDAKQLSAEKDKLGVTVRTLTQESAQLRTKVGELTEENVTLLRKAEQAGNRHNEQVKYLEEEVVRLKKESQKQQQLNEEQLNAVKSALCQARGELAEGEAEWNARVATLKQESRREREALQKEAEALSRECEETRKRLQEITDHKDKVEVELKRCGADMAIQELEHRTQLKQSLSKLETKLDDRIETLRERYEREMMQHEEDAQHQHQKELRAVKDELNATVHRLETTACELEIWKARTEKLQLGRSQILSRLQCHLQEQWSEAVQLLYESHDGNNVQVAPIIGQNPSHPGSEIVSPKPPASKENENSPVPQRDASSRTSGGVISPLQHYIHLLLKQPGRQRPAADSDSRCSGNSTLSTF